MGSQGRTQSASGAIKQKKSCYERGLWHLTQGRPAMDAQLYWGVCVILILIPTILHVLAFGHQALVSLLITSNNESPSIVPRQFHHETDEWNTCMFRQAFEELPPTGTIAEREAGVACIIRADGVVSRSGMQSTQHRREVDPWRRKSDLSHEPRRPSRVWGSCHNGRLHCMIRSVALSDRKRTTRAPETN
jgi:hypothetical protein